MSAEAGLLSVSKEGISMGTVTFRTSEQLSSRREEILASIGRAESELRAASETGALSGQEFEALSELDVIEFLLGEDESTPG